MTEASTVLLVDDEPGIRRICSRMLEKAGYHVVVAGESSEALSLLRERVASVDFAVVDYNMPKMNGLETIREMRHLKADLPVVLSTGYAGPDEVAGIRSSGRTTVLPKPFKSRDLVEALAQLGPDPESLQTPS